MPSLKSFKAPLALTSEEVSADLAALKRAEDKETMALHVRAVEKHYM